MQLFDRAHENVCILTCWVVYSLAIQILHFAEIYDGAEQPGDRVFDVLVEGTTVLNNFDIVVAAGGPYIATTETITGVSVTDGSLDITFGKITENPKVRSERAQILMLYS